ncbi:MAG TPA: DUF4157 domain-containing protein [Rhizomicrobium sp.]
MQTLLRSGALRAKLEVGSVDDPAEREADAVADQVMRSANGSPCSACAGKDDEETVRRKADAPASPAGGGMSSSGEARIRGLASGGENLSPHLRSFFEPRMNRDLSHVRVHTDGGAAEAASSIGARAYTLGSHIGFGAGHWQPDTSDGRRLIAHELAHTGQHNAAPSTVRREGPDPGSGDVAQSVDIIVNALEGITTGAASHTILEQFTAAGAAGIPAIMQELKTRGASHSMSGDEMVDWLLGDMTAEDRRTLTQLLIGSASPDIVRIVAAQIAGALGWTTSEEDSAEVYRLCAGFSGGALDDLLAAVERAMGADRDATRDALFGDLDRVNAERLRQLFFQQGTKVAVDYAASWTASKIMALIGYYTSHSDSTDIAWNFETTPGEFRGFVQFRLDALCMADGSDSAQAVLMQKMDMNDYNRLRTMGGLKLDSYVDTRSTVGAVFDDVVSGAEWVEVVAEWILCGVGGIVTGLFSVVGQLVGGLGSAVIGVYDVLMSLVYLLSAGAAGSGNWLAVKSFFTGIGTLFTDPGKVWDQYWEQQALEFHTIEGAFSDCRRAEFWVRKIVSAIINIVLIFVGGAGIAKGVASGAKALTEAAFAAETGSEIAQSSAFVGGAETATSPGLRVVYSSNAGAETGVGAAEYGFQQGPSAGLTSPYTASDAYKLEPIYEPIYEPIVERPPLRVVRADEVPELSTSPSPTSRTVPVPWPYAIPLPGLMPPAERYAKRVCPRLPPGEQVKLVLPGVKAVHEGTYDTFVAAGALQHRIGRSRSTNQSANWNAAMRGGYMDLSVMQKGRQMGLCTDQILQPNWTRRGLEKTNVDHIVEMQVTPIGNEAAFDQLPNYEVLDESDNKSAGSLLRWNIVYERGRLATLTGDPGWYTCDLTFTAVEPQAAVPAGRWNKDEIGIQGAHLQEFTKQGLSVDDVCP